MKNKAPEMAMELTSARRTQLREAMAADFALYERVLESAGELVTAV